MHTEYLFLCRHPSVQGTSLKDRATPSRQPSTTGCSTYVGHSVSAQLTQGTKTLRPQCPPPRHQEAEVGAGPRVPAANAQAVGSPALARACCASCRLARQCPGAVGGDGNERARLRRRRARARAPALASGSRTRTAPAAVVAVPVGVCERLAATSGAAKLRGLQVAAAAARGPARAAVGVSVRSRGAGEAAAAARGLRPRPQRGGGLECSAEPACGPCALAP